jgi:carbonic anhydrase/acetyltransferase-like protein (isoleucine patch superfamily)
MIYTLGEKRIETAGEDYYVAPGASVIGSVRFGAGASVWFNCVLRGDSDWINLGESVNIQDGTIIHTDEGEPVTLGARVSVGHRALLHGCTIAESTLIANGAMVLDRVKIGRHCIIAAGALVTPGKVIPDGSVVMGSPGQIVRQVNEKDLQMIDFIAEHYRARIQQYKRDLKLDSRSSS